LRFPTKLIDPVWIKELMKMPSRTHMKCLHIAGLCLASLLALGMVSAGSASAVEPSWLVCLEGKEGSFPTKYEANQCTVAAKENKGKWESAGLGTNSDTVRLLFPSLKLEDTKAELGPIIAKCSNVGGAGLIEGGNLLLVREVKLSSAECSLEAGDPFFSRCKRPGEIAFLHLPWVLQGYEEKGGKLMSRLQPSGEGKGEPGWKLTCGESRDECVSEAGKYEELGSSNRVSEGALLVLGEFLKKHKANCFQGGAETGVIEGGLVISLASGNGLSIKGLSGKACNKLKEKWVFCSGGKETSSIQELRATNGNPTILESKIKGVEVEIKCTAGRFEPTLEGVGDLTGTDKFESCTIPKPAGTCTVSGNAIKSEPIIGNLEGSLAGPPELKFEGVTSIARIKIEGCSAIEGEYTLKGKQKCKVDAAYGTEKSEHEFKCEKAGSTLELGAEVGTLSMTATGPLLGGGNWSMQLN
jgi:hypothetical protein